MSQSLTLVEARDEIMTLIKDALDTEPALPVDWGNKKFTPPSGGGEWARVTLNNIGSGQRTLGRPAVYQRDAILTVQIFTKLGHGMGRSDTLSQLLLDALEGQTTPSGVWFLNVSAQEIGEDGAWFNTNVTADVVYNEVK